MPVELPPAFIRRAPEDSLVCVTKKFPVGGRFLAKQAVRRMGDGRKAPRPKSVHPVAAALASKGAVRVWMKGLFRGMGPGRVSR